MNHQLLKALFVLGWFFICTQFSYAANVQCVSGSPGGIRLTGKIEAGDFNRVANCRLSTGAVFFVISSPGGSVSEAMKIGKYVRHNKMWVAVPPDGGICFSSCVYILAAGVIKWPWGEVGIHRPYFVSKPSQGYDTSLKALLDESRAYFREMNIPELLADDMFSISPQEMRMLSDSALSKYRLNQDDMAYDEEKANLNASAYGLSRQEYMRRLKQQERYMDDCLSRVPKPSSTSDVVHCGDWSYKKAGLILKN